ncbi:uncharacterized protein ACWYII_004948 isoform 1-T1 [Salvelinus alpinus]
MSAECNHMNIIKEPRLYDNSVMMRRETGIISTIYLQCSSTHITHDATTRQAEETTAHQACGRTDKKCDMGNIGLTQREAVHDEHHPQQGDLLKVMFSLSISLTLGLPLTWLTWLLPTLL